MKCCDLHNALVFANPNLSWCLVCWGVNLQSNISLYIWTFRSILSKTFFVVNCSHILEGVECFTMQTWTFHSSSKFFIVNSSPYPMKGWGQQTKFFCAVWIFHLIPSKIFLCKLTPSWWWELGTWLDWSGHNMQLLRFFFFFFFCKMTSNPILMRMLLGEREVSVQFCIFRSICRISFWNMTLPALRWGWGLV